MNRNSLKRENLEKEIESLEKELNTYTEKSKEATTPYNTYKAKRKERNKEITKLRTIRNLKITGYSILVCLPFALGITATTITTHIMLESQTQEKYIQMDNTGYYEEYQPVKETEGDKLIIETPYINKDGEQVTYTYKKEVDFSKLETVEEALQQDYLDLLNEQTFACINEQKATSTSDLSKKARISFRGDIDTNEKIKGQIFKKIMLVISGHLFGTMVFLLPVAFYMGDKTSYLISSLEDGYKYDNKKIKQLKKEKRK